MRILLIGGSGQLGSDIRRNAGAHEVSAPSSAELDIRRSADVEAAIRRMEPAFVINCAAFHNVPQCEVSPDEAFRINCVAVRDVAEACRKTGARLVTLSSDYVFGGERREPYREGDAPKPLQVYGMSRLAGEFAALSASRDDAIVVRTCGLYGVASSRSKGGNFVDGRIAEARGRAAIEVGTDQVVSPTSSWDLSVALIALLEVRRLEGGIYHLVNEGQCSWHEFTVAILEMIGSKTRVVPVDRGGLSGAMRRPLYSALANTRARALGITLPHWREALAGYLARKYPSGAPAL